MTDELRWMTFVLAVDFVTVAGENPVVSEGHLGKAARQCTLCGGRSERPRRAFHLVIAGSDDERRRD
jgi:hypothetical protein